MPILSKGNSSKSYTGKTIEVIGWIVAVVCLIAVVVWTLREVNTSYGVWATVGGAVLAPITYAFSVIIVWVATDHFEWLLLALYLSVLLGVAMIGIGKRWDREDNDF